MNMVSPPAPEVTAEDLEMALKDECQLIDVREPDEFEQVRIPQARLIPLGSLMEHHEELDRHRPVYVICAAGVRSMAAAGALRQVGVDALSVAGGTNGWAATDRPTDSGPVSS